MKAKKDKAKDAAVTKKEKKTNSQDKNAIIKAKDAVIKALDQNGNGTVDIEDALLHLVQKLDGFLHRFLIAESDRRGIVDHQHTRRSDQGFVASHCNNGSSTCRNAVDLDCDLALMIAEHCVDLRCRKYISAG
ncbi:MAG: hypothetical protein BWZ04_02183 [Firmicutes bacterium ADurb.BinA205]|nr:MAG: hypothetical protein BWZ04_02183 [Firmicutes bacterium ADurb.BinA205]